MQAHGTRPQDRSTTVVLNPTVAAHSQLKIQAQRWRELVFYHNTTKVAEQHDSDTDTPPNTKRVSVRQSSLGQG